MKKIILLLGLAMALSLLLTGCASSADTLPSPTPGSGNMLEPLMPNNNTNNNNGNGVSSNDGAGQGMQPTSAPSGGAEPLANGSQTLEGAQKAAQAMEEEVEKLSEVDDAYVVPLGDTALVGLKLTSQYQGGADERLKKMTLSRVRTVDKGITKVAVTENAALTAGIQALAETLKGASSLDDVNDKGEELLKQLTVYTE